MSLFQKRGYILERLISKYGYGADPQDSRALEKFRAPPKTVGELGSLLGFLGYYRCCIKKFSKILKLLYDLLKKGITKPKLKNTKTYKKKKTSQLDSNTATEWTEQHQLILNEILDILKSPELILFPDFEKLFMMYCDASETGLGSVLCQNQDRKLKFITYASRTLTPAKKNYMYTPAAIP